MTPEQLRLARHALGLPNKARRSYRNRFYAGGQHPEWRAMEAAGLAEADTIPTATGMTWFWLTRAGAEAALDPGERLCREDFPPPPRSRGADGHFARSPATPLSPDLVNHHAKA